MREPTLERNPMNVSTVGKPSVRVHPSFNMRELILERGAALEGFSTKTTLIGFLSGMSVLMLT